METKIIIPLRAGFLEQHGPHGDKSDKPQNLKNIAPKFNDNDIETFNLPPPQLRSWHSENYSNVNDHPDAFFLDR